MSGGGYVFSCDIYHENSLAHHSLGTPGTVFGLLRSTSALQTMEYKKRQKPFNNRMKYKIKRKDNRMNLAKEMEHQLPSSNRQNASDFFDSL